MFETAFSENLNSNLKVEELELYEDSSAWFKTEYNNVCPVCKEAIDYKGEGNYTCTFCCTDWLVHEDEDYMEELGCLLYTFLELLPEEDNE